MSRNYEKEKRGKRRKDEYRKAIRKYKLCNEIWGDAEDYNDGILGKYIDGKIHDHEDCYKTNSDWCGKCNYKHGDKNEPISVKIWSANI